MGMYTLEYYSLLQPERKYAYMEIVLHVDICLDIDVW